MPLAQLQNQAMNASRKLASVIYKIEQVMADLVIIAASMFLLGWTVWEFVSFFAQPTHVFTDNLKVNPIQGIDYMKQLSLAWLTRVDPKHVYDLEIQRQWICAHIAPNYYVDVAHCNPSYYTPPFCVLVIPLTFLPFEKGYLIWSFLQVIAAVVMVNKVIKVKDKPLDWLYFWIVVLASPGSRQSICLGQTGFLLAALLTGIYLAWRKDKQILAGVLLAFFALSKPHHCLIPGVMFIAKRQWKAFASLIVTSIILYLGAACVMGFDTVLNYPAFLAAVERDTYEGKFFAPRDICVNLRCILGYIFAPKPLQIFGIATTLMTAVASYAVWRKALLSDGKYDGHALFISLALSFVFGLHANFYDLAILSVPFAMSVSAVGVYSSFRLTDIFERIWSLSFLVFWFGSQLMAIYIPFKAAQNWHCAFLLPFCLISWIIFSRNCNKAIACTNTLEPTQA